MKRLGKRNAVPVIIVNERGLKSWTL